MLPAIKPLTIATLLTYGELAKIWGKININPTDQMRCKEQLSFACIILLPLLLVLSQLASWQQHQQAAATIVAEKRDEELIIFFLQSRIKPVRL